MAYFKVHIETTVMVEDHSASAAVNQVGRILDKYLPPSEDAEMDYVATEITEEQYNY